jgi:hypothetical protein
MIHDGVSIYLALRLTRTPTGDMASLHLPPYKEDDNGRNDTRVKQCQAEEHLRATGPRETLADGEKFLILDILASAGFQSARLVLWRITLCLADKGLSLQSARPPIFPFLLGPRQSAGGGCGSAPAGPRMRRIPGPRFAGRHRVNGRVAGPRAGRHGERRCRLVGSADCAGTRDSGRRAPENA